MLQKHKLHFTRTVGQVIPYTPCPHMPSEEHLGVQGTRRQVGPVKP